MIYYKYILLFNQKEANSKICGLDKLLGYIYMDNHISINVEGNTGLIVHFALTGTGSTCDCLFS